MRRGFRTAGLTLAALGWLAGGIPLSAASIKPGVAPNDPGYTVTLKITVGEGGNPARCEVVEVKFFPKEFQPDAASKAMADDQCRQFMRTNWNRLFTPLPGKKYLLTSYTIVAAR